MTKDIAKSVKDAKSYKPWEVEYIGYNLQIAEERRAGRDDGDPLIRGVAFLFSARFGLQKSILNSP